MTRQPRKQRYRTANAPLHERNKQVHATLDADLREEHGRRNVRVSSGDTVEVMRGDYAGETGEVMGVDLKSATVTVEGVTVEKSDGEEVLRPLDASNLRVTSLDLSDSRREDRIGGDGE